MSYIDPNERAKPCSNDSALNTLSCLLIGLISGMLYSTILYFILEVK